MLAPAGHATVTAFLRTTGGERIAYRRHRAGGDGSVMFLPGFHSDMTGDKAVAIEHWAQRRGCDCVRFDYRGHGESPGQAEDYVLSDWLADACLVVETLVEGRCTLVGSSMGAWLALHLAERYPAKICGLITVAAATDFTAAFVNGAASPEQLRALAEHGSCQVENRYGEEPYVITERMLEDAGSLLMLDRKIDVRCPVYLNHGTADTDVPWQVSERTMAALRSGQAELTLVRNGDHRLSSPVDLQRLWVQLDRLGEPGDRR